MAENSITAPSLMELQVQQQAIERQRQIAQLLQTQGLTAPEGQMVSGHYIAPGFANYAAKLGQALIGGDMQRNLDKKQVEFARQYMDQLSGSLDPNQGQSAAIGQVLKAGAAGGSVGPTVQNAQVMDALPQGGAPLNPTGMNKQLAAQFFMTDPKGYFAAQAKASDPTDLQKNDRYLGISRPQSQADELAKRTKAGYIAPVSVRGGATVLDPRTNQPIFSAPLNNGSQITYDALGNPSMRRISGADDTLAAEEAAKLRGKNRQTLAPTELSPVLPNGKVLPSTIDSTINGDGSMKPGQSDRLTILQQELESVKAQPNNPRKAGDIAALNREIERETARTGGVGPAYGQKEGAVNAQKSLDKSWSALTEQNRQAQTTNSYLQNIKDLATKAQTGQFSDRQQFVNSLLSYAGISGKATDDVTAKNLLDKYSNQITARLGQGGLGTDAARSILQSAYPNSKMTPEAIHEAADNLIGANQMVQAKAKLLAPHANRRDAVKYNEMEMQFDQNADPRIFQYANIRDAGQRAAFAKKLMQQDPTIVDKIKHLEALGAL